MGLLALMLLHEARRATRVDAAGDLVLLEDQDRSLWDRAADRRSPGPDRASACATRRVGPYVLQAAIAAVHAEAPSAGETDWAQIVALYDVLRRVDPSPVVALNRAVAIGMRDGPEAGLAGDRSRAMAQGGLDDYHLAHAARADMQRRLRPRSTRRERRTGRAVFERIVRSDEITVVELTRGSGVTQGAVSQHLKSLKQAGLVAERPEGRNVYYRAEPRGPRAARRLDGRLRRVLARPVRQPQNPAEGDRSMSDAATMADSQDIVVDEVFPHALEVVWKIADHARS